MQRPEIIAWLGDNWSHDERRKKPTREVSFRCDLLESERMRRAVLSTERLTCSSDGTSVISKALSSVSMNQLRRMSRSDASQCRELLCQIELSLFSTRRFPADGDKVKTSYQEDAIKRNSSEQGRLYSTLSIHHRKEYIPRYAAHHAL